MRISDTAIPTATSGISAAAAPSTQRNAVSIQPPTGPPAETHTATATTTPSASNASAMPSRRCPASMSRARLTVRVVAPIPRASTVHPFPTERPTTASGDGPCGRGLLTVRVVRDGGFFFFALPAARVPAVRARDAVLPVGLPAMHPD